MHISKINPSTVCTPQQDLVEKTFPKNELNIFVLKIYMLHKTFMLKFNTLL